MRSALLMALAGLALSSICLTQTNSQKPAVSEPSARAESSSQTTEISSLKSQLELMRFYDQRLLNTVYWSLGVVAGLAILLSGFSWYANFRIYERDKTALRQELEALVRGELATGRSRLEVAQQKLDDSISSMAVKIRDDLSKDLDALSAKTEAQAETSEKKARQALYGFQMEVYRFLAEFHEAQKNSIGAFNAYKNFLQACLNWGSRYFVMDALEGLKRQLKNGKTLSAVEYSDLLPLVQSIPEEFKDEIEPALRLLRSARTP